jgi:hypothetical protein
MALLLRLFAALSLVVWSTGAFAATGTVNFNGQDFGTVGGALEQFDHTMALPDGVDAGVSLSFTLPPDFKVDTNASLKFLFSTSQNINCNYNIVPHFVTRYRSGSVAAASLTPSQTGFNVKVAGPTPAPTVQFKVFAKSFDLSLPAGLSVTGQKAGDVIIVSFLRNGGNGADTCANTLYAIGAKLIYQIN